MDQEAYLQALQAYGRDWEERFPNFYRTRYWHLFIGLYKNGNKPITLNEAMDLLTTGDKDLEEKTLRSYIYKAEKSGLVLVRTIKGQRSREVNASDRLMKNIKEHLETTSVYFIRAFHN